VFTFTGGFPLVLVQLYLAVVGAGPHLPWAWSLYAALSATAVSTAWALAGYQRRSAVSTSSCSSCDECSSCSSLAWTTDGAQLLVWPGSLFRSVYNIP
jgi:hypothetical protein